MEKQEVLQAVYNAFNEHDFGSKAPKDLLSDLQKKFEDIPMSDLCYRLQPFILKCIQNLINKS